MDRPSKPTPQSVLLYESADKVMELAPLHYAAHSARVDDYRHRGVLVQVGLFDDVQKEGAMAVFVDRQAAEEFVAGDPFVLHGVVRSYEIRNWNVVF